MRLFLASVSCFSLGTTVLLYYVQTSNFCHSGLCSPVTWYYTASRWRKTFFHCYLQLAGDARKRFDREFNFITHGLMVYYESQLMLDLMSEGTQVSRILALAATQDKVH